jgi:hypothetical protein
VDVVTTRQLNLCTELMAFLGQTDPTMGTEPPGIYAASCRWLLRGDRATLQTWSHILTVGKPLPTLPLWLRRSEGGSLPTRGKRVGTLS